MITAEDRKKELAKRLAQMRAVQGDSLDLLHDMAYVINAEFEKVAELLELEQRTNDKLWKRLEANVRDTWKPL